MCVDLVLLNRIYNLLMDFWGDVLFELEKKILHYEKGHANAMNLVSSSEANLL